MGNPSFLVAQMAVTQIESRHKAVANGQPRRAGRFLLRLRWAMDLALAYSAADRCLLAMGITAAAHLTHGRKRRCMVITARIKPPLQRRRQP